MTTQLLKLVSSIILTVAVFMLGCSKKSSESSPPSDAQSKETKNAGASGKPDFSLDPAAWRSDWKDGQAALQKYQGKVIELKGVVARIGDDTISRGPTIYLKAEGAWTVRCITADKRPWLKVVPGSTIKVKGILPNAISFQDPHLAEAVVTDPGAAKPEFVTAQQITKAVVADRKAAKEKYHEKWVNLEGEIIDAKIVAGNDMIVRLKGDADAIVNCSIVKTGLENARPGQKVKVFGQLNIVDIGNVVYLYASGLTELK